MLTAVLQFSRPLIIHVALCLFHLHFQLVDLLFDEEVAAGVGSGLLIPWPPSPRPNIVAKTPTSR